MALFFFNRSKKKSIYDFGTIGLDMHSHLIPAVDDGAKDIGDSIELISALKELGFNHLITTPHTLQDIHPNDAKSLTNGYNLLHGKTPSDIQFHLSSEYYLDDQFQSQLNKDELLPMPGKRLLIEFSQISRPHNLENFIFEIGIKGYQVIIAHPERYLFFHKQFNYYTRLKEMGVEFQLNAMSLTEHYGKGIKLIAEKLIEKEMIDFIGTDIHHLKHIEVLRRVPESKHFNKLIDSGLLKNSLLRS